MRLEDVLRKTSRGRSSNKPSVVPLENWPLFAFLLTAVSWLPLKRWKHALWRHFLPSSALAMAILQLKSHRIGAASLRTAAGAGRGGAGPGRGWVWLLLQVKWFQ